MAENESLLDRQVNPDPPKDNRRKLRVAFIAIVLVGFGALVGNGVYRYIETERIAMADTYGGKTPSETLSLYAAALKKGDYELASKYFVPDLREDEISILNRNSAKEGSLPRYIKMLEEASTQVGIYSSDGKTFKLDREMSAVSLGMTLYPSGIWKISEF